MVLTFLMMCSLSFFAQTQVHFIAPSSILSKKQTPIKVDQCIESLATTRTDAYRCFAGNGIYDPCFLTSDHQLLCFLDPWSSPEKLISEKNLKQTGSVEIREIHQPWAFLLDNKVRCVFLTGATRGVQGERINYGCDDGNYVVGTLRFSQPFWRAKYFDHKQVKWRDVQAVWF